MLIVLQIKFLPVSETSILPIRFEQSKISLDYLRNCLELAVFKFSGDELKKQLAQEIPGRSAPPPNEESVAIEFQEVLISVKSCSY